MRKLIIQIPCYNEEKTLPRVIADLPRQIDGIDEIYTLVIDDGSTDNTCKVATDLGVDYIVRNGRNIGLAKSFNKGLAASLYLGADIIVNIDGDHQHRGQDIPKLVEPIIQNKADVVIGARNFKNRSEFSWWKGLLEGLGSYIVQRFSGTKVSDATCGFRALDRDAAANAMTTNTFTYTLELIIQAGHTGLKVLSVPIGLNPSQRKSRLFSSKIYFIFRQLGIMLKSFIFHRPMHFFSYLASFSFVICVAASMRIAYYLWFVGAEQIKFRSGTGAVLLISAIATLIFPIAGLLATVLVGIRDVLFDTRSRIRHMELVQKIPPIDCDIIKAPTHFQWKNVPSVAYALEDSKLNQKNLLLETEQELEQETL